MKEIQRIIDTQPIEFAASIMLGHMLGADKSHIKRVHEQRRLREEENARRNSIRMNICPICKGKLVRGKKNKKNDYKREWVCQTCDKTHTI